jgi:hypothetical protein
VVLLLPAAVLLLKVAALLPVVILRRVVCLKDLSRSIWRQQDLTFNRHLRI